MAMTPEQQALYNRILDESLLEVERAGAGVGAPPAPSYAPPPAPAYAGLQPPPSRMQAFAAPPSPAQGVPPPMPGPAGAGGDILPNPYGSPGPAPAAAPPPPMFPVPQRMDMRGLTGEPGVATRGLSPDELARARANPISDPSLDVQGMRPFPSQRPSRLAMMAGAEPQWGRRRLPPPPMPESGGGGGSGVDPGEVLGGIFPGLGRGIRQQRMQQAEMQARQQAQAAGFAHDERMLQRREEADRAGRAPGEAMDRERFAAWREDRDAEAKARTAASAAAEAKMRPDSGDSERRRAAFRAANPEFAVWMDKNDPAALGRIAAGDEPTWKMIQKRADEFKAKKTPGAGGARPPSGGPAYAAGLAAIEAGDTPGALKAADEMEAAGDRKGAAEMRKLAAQGALVARRGEEAEGKEGRKLAEAERGMMIGGWERDPGGPTVPPAEVKGLRDAVAQVEVLRGIGNELAQLNKEITMFERAQAALGIHSARTAHAMELQGQALTAIRTIEETGVPSLTEMAAAAKKAPELASVDGWLNGEAKYRGLVGTMDMRIGKMLGVRGYRKAGSGDQSQPQPSGGSKYAEGQTATGPGGQKMVFKGGKWGPL